MIRVAILADMPVAALEKESLGRGGGHAATWLPQLAQAFSSERSLEIHWVILSHRVREPVLSRFLGQTFHEIPRCPMTVDVLTGYHFSRLKLISALKRIRPDLIHAWGAEGAYPSVLGFARIQGIPAILSMQGILTEYHRIGSFRNNWRMRLQASYEKGWIRQATVVTSESNWGVDQVRRIAPGIRCRMVEYGVHPSFYDVSWKPSPSVPALLYSGGVDWRKGYDLLVDALKMKPVPSWKCWMAGNGFTPKEIASLPSNVEVLGNLPWKQLQDRMVKAWGLVIPTRADSGPTAVKEARVIGLPVISSRNGGQASYIKHGDNGFILDPMNPRSLRRAMDELMSNYSTCCQMGHARHEVDRDYFKPEKTARTFASLYQELAGEVDQREPYQQ